MNETERYPSFDLGLFRLGFQQKKDGLCLTALTDLETGRQWLVSDGPPLFSIVMKNAVNKTEVEVDACQGWSDISIEQNENEIEMKFHNSEQVTPENLEVQIKAVWDAGQSALSWTLRVIPEKTKWKVWAVKFPRLAWAEPGSSGCLFLPRGPGEAAQKVWHRDFDFHQMYPNGWCSMSYFAIYSQPGEPETGRGLYIGFHDPRGAAKDFRLKSNPDEVRLDFECEYPAEERRREGNTFTLPGTVVWRLFNGDWYDAALLYREWSLEQSSWIPAGKVREETPGWFRDSLVWIRLRGDAAYCVPVIKEYARKIGLPVGFHWYNWHEIPYDNDYPHFFPAKPGFLEGIRQLQEAGIRVMPYINGRLWDTRDKGLEDWKFTEEGLPGATKDEDGQPFTEEYGSVEEDGSPVQLAVMCPASQVWREKLLDLTHRLFDQYGVDGIYIDQIAASSPQICMDPTHFHQPGGGAWWNEAYWAILDMIREFKPKDGILTTECNAEPFLHKFDGFLTWHWQYEEQVPAFSVVYGGKIQMFGRSFRLDAMKGQALRMKAGQQLVFGEQIGWVESADVLEEPESLYFLRQMGLFRRRFHQYFDAGRMFRPPVLLGENPEVQADWRWIVQPWPVKGKSVLTGAWGIAEGNKRVLFFVNVSDADVSLQVDISQTLLELSLDKAETLLVCQPEGEEERIALEEDRLIPLHLGPREAVAWELGT